MKIEQFMDKLMEIVDKAEIIEGLHITATMRALDDDTVDKVECNIEKYIAKNILDDISKVAAKSKENPMVSGGGNVVTLPHIEKGVVTPKPIPTSTESDPTKTNIKQTNEPKRISDLLIKGIEVDEEPLKAKYDPLAGYGSGGHVYGAIPGFEKTNLVDQFGRPIFVNPLLTGPNDVNPNYFNSGTPVKNNIKIESDGKATAGVASVADSVTKTNYDPNVLSTLTAVAPDTPVTGSAAWNNSHSLPKIDSATALADTPNTITAALNNSHSSPKIDYATTTVSTISDEIVVTNHRK